MQNRTYPYKLALIGLALFALACGRERTDPTSQQTGIGTAPDTEVEVEIPTSLEWVPTGIILDQGLRVVIETQALQRPKGSFETDPFATIPTYGLHGVIARVGDSLPVAVGDGYVFQGSSLTQGQEVFVGRNLAPVDPFADQATETSDASSEIELVVPSFTPEPYTVVLRTEATNSPTLLTPIDGFYDEAANPVFDWDDQNNAAQYSVDISRFPDFRSILFNFTSNSTSLNTAVLGVDPTDPINSTNPNLSEGVYYWRVRGQINTGRTLQPNLEWTERSVVFRLGVELEQTLPSPTILSPSSELSLSSGDSLTVEFIAPRDASGLLWRYELYNDSCGAVINPDEELPVQRASWMAFQSEYAATSISDVPPLYAFFRTGALAQGQWLIRVQTRDGADDNANRLGNANYRLDVGCN